MQPSEAYEHIISSQRRAHILSGFNQPITAHQLARKLHRSLDACRRVVFELRAYGAVACLNPNARRSRVYWLTRSGKTCQQRLAVANAQAVHDYFVPDLDWELYGWVCFSHRAATIKALKEALQPSAIKRRARALDPELRMSANNVRDVIRLFAARGIVRRVECRKHSHPRYELTDIGRTFQELLRRAEEPA